MTFVLGLACTAGPEVDTHLYLDDIRLTCGGATTAVVDVGGLGNVDLGAAPSENAAGYLFAAQVHRGAEALAHKLYWNVALGVDRAALPAAECRLTTTATASAVPLADLTTAAGAVYPLLRWDVVVTADGARACTRHAVDQAPLGVATTYTDGDGVHAFQHGVALPAGCDTDADCADDALCTLDTCVDGLCVAHACTASGAYACAGCGAVYASCAELLGQGLPSGVYTLDPDGDGGVAPFPAYCDTTGGWTLVESFALANAPDFATADFAEDFPQNVDTPTNAARYRLGLAQIQALEAHSTEWLAACNLDTRETRDFMRGALGAFAPSTATGNPTCTLVDAVDIRGAGCTRCTVPLYQWDAVHLSADATSTACGVRPWQADAVASEDAFGYYVHTNPAFGCTATAASTTQWWVRNRVCAPSSVSCQSHAVITCDPTGTIATVSDDCGARGESCVAGACVSHAQDCSELVGQGLPDGVYTLDPDGGGTGVDPFDVWCDLARGWTLIESFSLGNNAQVATVSFAQDAPRNAATPANAALHRLGLAQMRALEATSTEWLATCNLDTTESANFIRAPLTSLRPTTFTGTNVCTAVTAADIRGYGCSGCSVALWQEANVYHLVTDSSGNTCGVAPWTTGAVASEDNFGFYGTTSASFPCTANSAATTNWWLRDLRCTPDSASCSGDLLQACNAVGTGYSAVTDCTATGQVCAVDACEAPAPGTARQPVTTCAALAPLGITTDGVYWVDPDGPGGGAAFEVWCDADRGWTLFESIALANNAQVRVKEFSVDAPLNTTAPDNHALHRLSLAQIQALEAASTEWLATCNLDTSETLDFIRAPIANLRPTTFAANGACRTVSAADIRGHGCTGCSVPFWQGTTSHYHLVVDSSLTLGCANLPWTATATSSEDNFGYYGTVNPVFSCVSSASATTNWWFR